MVEIAAIILAAGSSSRFKSAGGGNATKLAAPLAGKPLVRHAAEAALASGARPIVVVTGHDRKLVEAALAGLDLRFVHNPVYRQGLASSLQAGVATLPASVAGVLVLLGDMPGVTSALIDKLIAVFVRRPDVFAVAPAVDGRRGNPVLLARVLFPSFAALAGDQGARKLLDDVVPDKMVTVEIPGPASILDVDTPLSLAEARRLWEN